MEKVYVVLRSEYAEDVNETEILSIHKTLDGALDRFREAIWNVKADYMYNETGSTDTSKEAEEMAGIESNLETFADGTPHWHMWLPCSWHEVFVDIYERNLYE